MRFSGELNVSFPLHEATHWQHSWFVLLRRKRKWFGGIGASFSCLRFSVMILAQSFRQTGLWSNSSIIVGFQQFPQTPSNHIKMNVIWSQPLNWLLLSLTAKEGLSLKS